MEDKEKSKPVHRIRAGSLELAIWRNEGEKEPWFSVTASRSYKQGEEWKQSDSFGHDDLLVLAKLLGFGDTILDSGSWTPYSIIDGS